jgi:hypothetical protein
VNETVAAGPASLEGAFFSIAHSTMGTARVVEPAAGERVLTLTGFRTDPGPDLYLYVAAGRTPGEEVDGATRLARLKGNVGNQQYELPAGLDLGEAATVSSGAARSPSRSAPRSLRRRPRADTKARPSSTSA